MSQVGNYVIFLLLLSTSLRAAATHTCADAGLLPGCCIGNCKTFLYGCSCDSTCFQRRDCCYDVPADIQCNSGPRITTTVSATTRATTTGAATTRATTTGATPTTAKSTTAETTVVIGIPPTSGTSSDPQIPITAIVIALTVVAVVVVVMVPITIIVIVVVCSKHSKTEPSNSDVRPRPPSPGGEPAETPAYEEILDYTAAGFPALDQRNIPLSLRSGTDGISVNHNTAYNTMQGQRSASAPESGQPRIIIMKNEDNHYEMDNHS